MSFIREPVAFFLIALFLASCGNKGDLYIPDTEPTMQTKEQTQSKR